MGSDRFAMDPASTGAGLTAAGETRETAAGSAFPALPQGFYVAPVNAAAITALAAATGQVEAATATGMASAEESVTAVETTEDTNGTILTT